MAASSNITAVAFSYEDEGTLSVTFTRGDTYRYKGVPEAVYDDLVATWIDPSASLGRRFHQIVENVGYDYERVEA